MNNQETMQPMQSNHQFIAEAYRAFNARDIDAALVLMHPNVDWPNGMEGGRVIGHDAIREYWTRQWKIVSPHVDPTAMEDDAKKRTVVSVHQVVKDMSGNIFFDQTIRHIYTLREGLIVRMDIMDIEEIKTE